MDEIKMMLKTYAGEQGQDGAASVAANHGDINLGDVQTLAVEHRVETLGH
jgi:hypothetical protein